MERTNRIQKRLESQLKIHHIKINDFSDQHSGHFNSIAQETHLEIWVVSNDFIKLPKIQRHRKINQLLKPEFESGLHALKLHTLTPDEWLTEKPL